MVEKKKNESLEEDVEHIDEITSELEAIEKEIDEDNPEPEDDEDLLEKERKEYMKKNNIKKTDLFTETHEPD